MTSTTTATAIAWAYGASQGTRRDDPGELLGDRRAAEGAHEDADERDARLHRGEEPRRVLDEVQGRAGPLVALVGELLEPGAARGDQRGLGHRQEAVQQYDRNTRMRSREECRTFLLRLS